MVDKKLFNGIYRGKKVFITGHTGFKGSWMALWLKEMGATVKGYALKPNTTPSNWDSMKLGIESVIADIRDKKRLIKEMQDFQPDFAFHLAAQPIVLDSYNDPHYTFETNLMGTVNFLEAVRHTPSVKVAINVTSDKCYQNKEWLWGYREDEAFGGDDPYSASKGGSEIITQSYIKSFFSAEGTANVASARAGNVIGGGDWADFRIVPDFFRAMQKGEALEIRNPYSTRPWQHVLEPLSGYLTLAQSLWEKGKAFSGGWNFGPLANEQHSVKALIEGMIEYCQCGSYTTPQLSDKPHEAVLLGLDISKAMYQLKWKPALSFAETIKFTADGYMSEINKVDLLAARTQQLSAYVDCFIDQNT